MGTIYLVRHAQASFGAADYDQLSELGLVQARALGGVLGRRLGRVDVVVCGAMRRHRQTAEACLSAMELATPLATDAGWNEYDHVGVVAALASRAEAGDTLAHVAASDDPRRAFQLLFRAAAERWVSGAHDGDYRESWAGFQARVDGALRRLAAGLGRGQSALVFTSGGPIAVAAGALLGVPTAQRLELSWTLANAGVTKLLCRDGDIAVSTLNEHAHFEGAERGLLTYR